ncbi:GGDEF domain-containing protein [Granulicella cerasi]|uniref:GGDEF domain-containing protein n=1 Tax=Granulicella cerasi TaxID=741063 RepID=UPI0021DFBF70|nr:GGDEF domain-containing protein [Granulicella cerasi]
MNKLALKLEPIERATARLRNKPASGLRFEPELEAIFDVSTRYRHARRRLWLGWTILFMYDLLILSDFRHLHSNFRFALAVRLLVTLWLAFSSTLHFHARRVVRELNVVSIAIAIVCSNLILYRNLSPVLSSVSQVNTLVALLMIVVLAQLRFPYAVFATATLFAMQLWSIHATHIMTVPQAIFTIRPIVVGELFILLAGFSMEREERLSFLSALRVDLQREKLVALNRELALLSSQDSLSGLANRASFDSRFEDLWNQAVETSKPLSVVLFDIDHFKNVNDTQGHLYGDEVIRRVSQLLVQSLRGKEDFAARYGGEEFVILLPDTSHAVALKVAQRIRRMVELAGSPAFNDDEHVPNAFTTLSGGVATYPGVGIEHRDELLREADVALYAAKDAGRNRIHSAALQWSEASKAQRQA